MLLLSGGEVVAAVAVDPVADAPPVKGKSGNRDNEEEEEARTDDDAATETDGEAEKEPVDGRVEITPAGPRKGEEA